MKVKDDDHLMFIEPQSSKCENIDDELTRKTWEFIYKCRPGKKVYRGFHTCACGITSDSQDWFTPLGRKTHSLLLHYVRDHRSEIPQAELDKLSEEIAWRDDER